MKESNAPFPALLAASFGRLELEIKVLPPSPIRLLDCGCDMLGFWCEVSAVVRPTH